MTTNLVTLVQQSIAASVISGALIFVMCALFVVIEPTVSRGANASTTDIFIVRQQVTGELAFLVPAADVVMQGAIGGVTGGTATGTTYAVVRTNSPTGYTVDIRFSNSPAMRGEETGSTAIHNYNSTGTQPTYNFNSSSSAQFGYTVTASSTDIGSIAQSFLDNGSNACNELTGNDTDGEATCWMGPRTTDFRIFDKGDSAPNGATTSLYFRVVVPANPSPAVIEDFYMATATLTAASQ